MRVSRFALILPIVCGCSSRPAPAYQPLTPSTYDFLLEVRANGGSERLVLADLTLGNHGCSVQETVSNCVHSVCPVILPAPTGAGDAGTISVSSPSLGMQSIALVGGYGRLVQPGEFKANESVDFALGGGADIVATKGTLTIPTDISNFALDGCSAGASACSVSAAPLATWAGGAEGQLLYITITLPFSDYARGDQLETLTCGYAADLGSGGIPKDALAKFPAGTARVDVRIHGPFQVPGAARHSMLIVGTRASTQTLSIKTGT